MTDLQIDPAETAEPTGALTGSTRRTFVRGIAAAGASTVVAASLDQSSLADLFADEAEAQTPGSMPFSDFKAVAPASADVLEIPEGYRADLILKFGDEFRSPDQVWRYGYNNDWLAYFPLNGSDEGLIFVNHEYPAPFFMHGYKKTDLPGKNTKSQADIQFEMESVGNSIVHIKRDSSGVFKVVSPSEYNRRIFGGRIPGKPVTRLEFTGPLRGAPGIGNDAPGTVGNCSGGITPWGTALSCEENYDGYGFALGTQDFYYGWGSEYDATTGSRTESKRYGWVCEHDPYDPLFIGKKHTALGRFRHENTAFNQQPGKPFVLYMGDDQANQAVYKFISDRPFIEGDKTNNLQILQAGTLYVAKWLPEGRRRFETAGDTVPISPTAGTGEWIKVETSELEDTRLKLGGFLTTVSSTNRRPKQGTVGSDSLPQNPRRYAGRFNRDVTVDGQRVNEWDTFFATNRPEDVEVSRDGSVLVALTNNSSVRDSHGSVRRLVEDASDPTATRFTWEDFAAGGPSGRADRSESGFSSPDNLVFDSADNLWVVTDISSGSLNKSSGASQTYQYHANNAVFMVPRSGPNKGVAFRFANMPVESEGTGPYFTPDEKTLFVNVQHPGEETANSATSVFNDPKTYSSWWPLGNKTTGFNPQTPLPSTVAITKVGTPDRTLPTVKIDMPKNVRRSAFARSGLGLTLTPSEPGRAVVSVRARIGDRELPLGNARVAFPMAMPTKVRVKAGKLGLVLLRGRRAKRFVVVVRMTDTTGNTRTTREKLAMR